MGRVICSGPRRDELLRIARSKLVRAQGMMDCDPLRRQGLEACLKEFRGCRKCALDAGADDERAFSRMEALLESLISGRRG